MISCTLCVQKYSTFNMIENTPDYRVVESLGGQSKGSTICSGVGSETAKQPESEAPQTDFN